VKQHGMSEKAAVRTDLLSARRRMSEAEFGRAAEDLAHRALGLEEIAGARTVAAYVSVGREPDTRALMDMLRARGTRVLLPVLMADDDLDWAAYDGADHLVRASLGLLEPDGPRLGPDAVLEAEVVLLPGLAVDAGGMRLGRGGGSYDRVLARLAAAGARPLRAVLLYDAEVIAQVPAEPHDLPVAAAVTPSGVHRFTEPDTGPSTWPEPEAPQD
jgi:5-formyltetrahydrofolate cyclo-ligase